MAAHRNEHFENMAISLDGETYEGCSFKACVFRYRGSKPVVLNRCQIESDCTLDLTAEAANTAGVLSALCKTPMRERTLRYVGISLEEQS